MAHRSPSPVFAPFLACLAGLLAIASCASGGDLPALQAGAPAGGDAGAAVETGAGACTADVLGDPHNCGGCGKACASSESCDHGVCVNDCPSQQTSCPGVGCVDLSDDLHNCGACGVVCAQPSGGTPRAACSGGQCTYDCGSPGLQVCAGSCVDLTTSTSDCGACGNACGAGQACQGGVCCGGASAMCGGTCIDVTHDPANCGACSHACASGAQCASGACVGYASAAATAPFVDACSLAGHQVLLPSTAGWETSAPVPLPFDVTFFGAKQTQFWVGSQGTLGLGPPPSSSSFGYPTCPLPDSFNAYAAVVAFGDSIDTTAGGVCWGTTGSAPGRQLVVTWSGATHEYDPGSVLTFSVVVAETTGTIDVVYETATTGSGGGGYVRGSGATVGLQGAAAGTASEFACGQGSNDLYNATPYAVRFTPL